MWRLNYIVKSSRTTREGCDPWCGKLSRMVCHLYTYMIYVMYTAKISRIVGHVFLAGERWRRILNLLKTCSLKSAKYDVYDNLTQNCCSSVIIMYFDFSVFIYQFCIHNSLFLSSTLMFKKETNSLITIIQPKYVLLQCYNLQSPTRRQPSYRRPAVILAVRLSNIKTTILINSI